MIMVNTVTDSLDEGVDPDKWGLAYADDGYCADGTELWLAPG